MVPNYAASNAAEENISGEHILSIGRDIRQCCSLSLAAYGMESTAQKAGHTAWDSMA